MVVYVCALQCGLIPSYYSLLLPTLSHPRFPTNILSLFKQSFPDQGLWTLETYQPLLATRKTLGIFLAIPAKKWPKDPNSPKWQRTYQFGTLKNSKHQLPQSRCFKKLPAVFQKKTHQLKNSVGVNMDLISACPVFDVAFSYSSDLGVKIYIGISKKGLEVPQKCQEL